MARVPIVQAATWPDQFGGRPYSDAHCLQCGRPVVPGSPRLRVARDDGGNWYAVSADEPAFPGPDKTPERVVLPIGWRCLRRNPDYCVGVVSV